MTLPVVATPVVQGDVVFSGALTAQEYSRAAWVHVKPRPVFAALGILIVGGMSWMLWSSFFGTHPAKPGVAEWGVLAFLVFLATDFATMPYRVRRVFRETKTAGEMREYRVSDEGIHVTSPDGSGVLRWDGFVKWTNEGGLFLLYINRAQYYIIPERMLRDVDVVELRRMLQQRVKH